MAQRGLRWQSQKVTRKEFRDLIAGVATELRQKIEAEVTGLDDSPAAIAERRAKALAADGYEFFVRTYFPHYIKSESSSSLHKYLFKRLPEIVADPRGQNDAIAAPRGEAKSTHCSQLFPIWCIARNLKFYILLLMDAFDQAASMLEAIKVELEANPRLKLDFPEICGQGRVWKEGVAITHSGVKLQAFGNGKRLRGMRHGPHRPDLVVLDDIENDENVRRPEQRDKTEDWVDKAVANVGAADGSLDQLYIGTILHYDSVLARKLRNPMWKSIKLSSIRRWPDRMDLWERWEEILRNDGRDVAEVFYQARREEMEEGAEVSWPEVRPLYSLMELRVRIGVAAFDAEQQNDPISSEDALFGNVTFWVERLSNWIFFGACDPSLGKQNKGRDPSAVLIGGMNRETGVLDVVEASIRRRLPSRIISDIIAFQEEYRCLKWAIEAVQFQEFFRTQLVAESAKLGVPVPAVPVIPQTDKALRIECIQPHVGNALIRLHPRQQVLIDQMRHYPMVDHDDGLDALEMLWAIAIGGKPSAGATVEDKNTRSSERRGMFGRNGGRRMFERRSWQ